MLIKKREKGKEYGDCHTLFYYREEEITMLKFDEVFNHKTLQEAALRVKRKNGSCGVDGMSADETYAFFKKKYKRDIVMKKLRKNQFIIHQNRIAAIPKDDGKLRFLKIQTTIDRVILDALANALKKRYNSMFSSSSFAYMDGKGAHSAIEAVNNYYEYESCRYAMKVDLYKYFDRISHKILFAKLKPLVDEPLFNLIKLFVTSGTKYANGIQMGSPISPFLSNLFLNEFDKEMEKLEGIRYLRYADDLLFISDSKEKINKGLLKKIENKLTDIKIRANEEKIHIGKLTDIEYLGFIKTEYGFDVSNKRIQKFYDVIGKLSVITDEKKAVTKLDEFIIGWLAYYHPASIYPLIKSVYETLIETHPTIRNYPEILLQMSIRKSGVIID